MRYCSNEKLINPQKKLKFPFPHSNQMIKNPRDKIWDLHSSSALPSQLQHFGFLRFFYPFSVQLCVCSHFSSTPFSASSAWNFSKIFPFTASAAKFTHFSIIVWYKFIKFGEWEKFASYSVGSSIRADAYCHSAAKC